MATSGNVEVQTRETVEQLSRSVATLLKTGRTVVNASANVVERELAMVIRISEALRDETISRETLESARKEPIPAQFRQDLHQAVDLMVDVAAVAGFMAFRFVDSLADGLVTNATPATKASLDTGTSLA